jgi:hypothetical protein
MFMLKKSINVSQYLAVTLALSLAVCSPLMAMGGYAGDQISKGLIQKIDYLNHSITVNGQTYKVSPTAKFHGVNAFSVLSIGLPVQITLGAAANSTAPSRRAPDPSVDQPQVIVGVTWLPGGIR